MPKRIVAVVAAALVLIGLLIVNASPAQDSPASKPPAAALLAVDSAPDLHAQSLKALDRQLGKAAWLADVLKHRQWLADQEAARKAAAAKAAAQAAQAQKASPGPSGGSGGGSSGGGGSGGSGGCASGYVHDLIVTYFSPLGSANLDRAFFVAQRESNCDPSADNPNSTAGGVYQWLEGSWAVASQECGYGGSSRYSAQPAVAVSACWVRNHGWGAWGF